MSAPIRRDDRIEVRLDGPAIHRGWRAIEARLDAGGGGGARWRWWGGGALAFAAAAVVVVAVVVGLWGGPGGGDGAPVRRGGPLMLADRGVVPAELVEDVVFADGSAVTLAGARLSVLENAPDVVALLLREGRARFSVQPGGPRRWIVEAGAVRVEVVGTVFAVTRRGGAVTVAVERGVVLVRGDAVPDGIRRLEAGEVLEIGDVGELAAVAAPVMGAEVEVLAAVAEVVEVPRAGVVPTRRAAEVRPTRVSGSVSGSGSVAGSVAGSGPVSHAVSDSASVSVEALLAEADRRRRDGDRAGALAILAQAGAVSDDPLAAVAWLTRARVWRELDRPSDAARDLERALARGLPAALETQARRRLDEARRAAGETPP